MIHWVAEEGRKAIGRHRLVEGVEDVLTFDLADLSAAFDTIDRDLLLDDLFSFGVY